MSKLLDSLNQVQATMTEATTTAVPQKPVVIPQDIVVSPAPKAVSTPVVAIKEQKEFHINKQTFYSIFGAVMVIVVMALILSFKAFTLISERNFELSKLSGVITKQNEKIKSLEGSIEELNTQQTQQLALLSENFSSMEKLINKNTKEMAELAVNHEILNDTVKDLKASNKDLKNNYNSVTAEISKVKQMVAQMMEGTAKLP